MFMQTPVQIGGLVLTILICGWAIWRCPGRPRLAAWGAVACFVLTPLVQDWSDWKNVQWGIFFVDLGYLVWLVWLMRLGAVWWLRLMTASQLLTALSHLTMWLNLQILARAYAATTYVLWFVLLAGLAWGCWRSRRRNIYNQPGET